MSLVDRTNETIDLSMHKPHLEYPGYPELGGVPAPSAILEIDLDLDSSIHPEPWVAMSLSDSENDVVETRLTMAEAELVYARLGLILGKS